ncbi:MAG: BLUF domain-containing protein [Candidatus Sericytochromatia bacterium]
MLNYLLYLSQPVSEMNDSELIHLLFKARERNKQKQVSGLLMYRPAYFMQYLEGESDTVKMVFELIESDRRHKNLLILDQGEIPARLFPTWSMGFYQDSFWKSSGVEGLNDLLLPEAWPPDFQNFMPMRILKNFAESSV